jgi:hypothetical protein
MSCSSIRTTSGRFVLSPKICLELEEDTDEGLQVPEEFAAILGDQDLFNNPSQLTSKEILARAEAFVRKPRRTPVPTTIRGEVHPHRPDLQSAYSAPAVSRSGGVRLPGERPASVSAHAANSNYMSRPPLVSPQAHSFHVPHHPVQASPYQQDVYRRPQDQQQHDIVAANLR